MEEKMCTFRLYLLGYHFFAPQKLKKLKNKQLTNYFRQNMRYNTSVNFYMQKHILLYPFLLSATATAHRVRSRWFAKKKATFCLRLITSTIDPDKNPFTTHTQSIQQAACQTSPKNLHSSLLLCTAHRQTNNSRLEGGCPLF